MNIPSSTPSSGKGLENLVKWLIIAVVTAGPVYLAFVYLAALSEYLRVASTNFLYAIPGIIAAAVVTSPIWNANIRTTLMNWIDVISIGTSKALVRSNPVGWLQARIVEMNSLVNEMDNLIEQLRSMIGRLTGELKSNREQMGKVSDLDESAQEQQEELEKALGEFNIDDVSNVDFDLEKLDKFESVLTARNDKAMAETQAMSLQERNQDIASLVKDFIEVWKFMVELKADMKLVLQQMNHELKTIRDKHELAQSVFGLLRKAHKFSRDSLKGVLDNYAKEYVNEQYSMAIAAFKNFRSQGSDMIREAALNKRAASRKAKDILSEYRRMKAGRGQSPDVQIQQQAAPQAKSSRVQQ